MDFKIGDKVRIAYGKGYFGDKYEGTEAEVVSEYSDSVFQVRCFDGMIFTGHSEHLVPIEIPSIIDPNTCPHIEIYHNKISRTLQFYVCRKCKQEVKR